MQLETQSDTYTHTHKAHIEHKKARGTNEQTSKYNSQFMMQCDPISNVSVTESLCL